MILLYFNYCSILLVLYHIHLYNIPQTYSCYENLKIWLIYFIKTNQYQLQIVSHIRPAFRRFVKSYKTSQWNKNRINIQHFISQTRTLFLSQRPTKRGQMGRKKFSSVLLTLSLTKTTVDCVPFSSAHINDVTNEPWGHVRRHSSVQIPITRAKYVYMNGCFYNTKSLIKTLLNTRSKQCIDYFNHTLTRFQFRTQDEQTTRRLHKML
jgi:hypothetical protein